VAAEAGDGAERHGRDDRGVAPRLASVRVRQVELDHRPFERGERVVDGPRVVRERAGIDDDRGDAPTRGVDGLDELALVVRLEVLQREAVALGGRSGRGDVITEG